MSGLSPEQNNGVSIENQAQAPEQVSISTLIEIWNYGMNDMLQVRRFDCIFASFLTLLNFRC